jgi:hypothetical protein
MVGIRDPVDGSVFETLEEAIAFCMTVMVSLYESRPGMSDARIEPFPGPLIKKVNLISQSHAS